MSISPKTADSTDVSRPTFTADDQMYCETYLANRTLLLRMWDLATHYPNIASRIRVTIRRADRKRDYHYEPAFADAAIVVRLEWRDAREVCSMLSCNHTYPRGRVCRIDDAPRIFPSGDDTTVSACEPACYMITAASTSKFPRESGAPANPHESNSQHSPPLRVAFDKDRQRWNRETPTHVYDDRTERHYIGRDECVRMRTDGHYEVLHGASRAITKESGNEQNGPEEMLRADLPFLQYNRDCDCCELGNVELHNFFTQPWTRSSQHNVCRQDNIMIGDDLTEGTGDLHGETTARHSRTYCNVFDKDFDAKSRTCSETWYDTFLSYTFLGSALIRLARHAIHGGDGCATVFPTDANRAQVEPNDVAAHRRSRNAWFVDVLRDWSLPPPNVLLSDLGLDAHNGDSVWTNDRAAGGSLRPVTPRDHSAIADERFESGGAGIAHQRSRRALQRRAPPSSRGEDNPPIANSGTLSTTSDNRSLLQYDQAYASLRQPDNQSSDEGRIDRLGSTIFRRQVETIAEMCGAIGASVLAETVLSKLARITYRSVLRNVGQYMTGYTSRTLVAMGVRVTAARLTGVMLSRLSTRMLLIAGHAATGVGAVIAAVEFIALLLDVMLLAGWDPGNYNSEFDNDLYDDMVRGWQRAKSFEQSMRFDPHALLLMFCVRDERENGSGGRLFGADRNAVSVNRMRIGNTASAPWYFAPFPDAVTALLNDETSVEADAEHASLPLTARPSVVTDNEGICTLLWSMHYFRHRRHNSNGQRVSMAADGDSEHEDSFIIDDDSVTQNVRDSELAFMLRTASDTHGLSRANLVGVVRRSATRKIINCAYDVVLIALCALGSIASLSLVAPKAEVDASGTPATFTRNCSLLLSFVALVALPLLVAISAIESFACTVEHDRSFDRANFDKDRGESSNRRAGDDGLAGELCDTILHFAVRDTSGVAPTWWHSFADTYLRSVLTEEIRTLEGR